MINHISIISSIIIGSLIIAYVASIRQPETFQAWRVTKSISYCALLIIAGLPNNAAFCK